MRRFALIGCILAVLAGGCLSPDPEPSSGSVYFVLGVLDEYTAHKYIENDDLVERFGLVHEKLAGVFVSHLRQIADEQDIQTEITIEQDGLQLNVISPEMAEFVISQYTNVVQWGFTDEEPSRRVFEAFISMDVLEPGGEAAKIQYLTGVYLRFYSGTCHCLRIVNASHKVELIKELLIALGCRDVQHDYIAGYPSTSFIWFQPSPVLDEAFGEAINDGFQAPTSAIESTLKLSRRSVFGQFWRDLRRKSIIVPTAVQNGLLMRRKNRMLIWLYG